MNSIVLPDEAATLAFGKTLAENFSRGGCIALSGDLGAGKTCFARGFIRALAGENTNVPSPTFTLVQHYDATLPGGESFTLAHWDLYRIRSASELEEAGFSESLEGGALVEWPELARPYLPAHAIWLELSIDGAGRRAQW